MHDPQREAARWLTQAATDLDAARALQERFAALACFHAQQAAEKALKSVLYATGQRVVLGHALSALGDAVQRHSSDYAEFRAEVAKLDRFYIPTRYPNGLPIEADPASAFGVGDAIAAISTAGLAVEHARDFLERVASADDDEEDA